MAAFKKTNSTIGTQFKNKDITSLDQFDPSSIRKLFRLTTKMAQIAKSAQSSRILAGNIVTLLFYEPSSRTMGSFDAAIKQLGGQTVVIMDPKHFSSVSKGETLEDTIKVFEAYSDSIVIRHPECGTAQKAADAAQFVPIINAGDGIGEHPTQALLDMYTIYEKYKRLSDLTIVMAGDIKNGRTVHSLMKGLSLYKNNSIYLLAPELLKLERADLKLFQEHGLTIHEITSVDQIPKKADVWYWTRVQKERFNNESEYQAVNNKFVVTPELLKKYASAHMILMHPLPRVGEISEDVDTDPRAVYLRTQIRNGMYIRMALMALVLGKDHKLL
jgi:aspartate carbamoyltransferase